MGGHATGAAPATAPAPASGAADVNVTLGDMYVKADTSTVDAGKVTFTVKNERAPGARDGDGADAGLRGGMLEDAGLLAKGTELAAGATDSIR